MLVYQLNWFEIEIINHYFQNCWSSSSPSAMASILAAAGRVSPVSMLKTVSLVLLIVTAAPDDLA